MLLLENEGIDLKGNLLDNSLMHYLLNPETSHRQEMLAKTFLGIDLERKKRRRLRRAFSILRLMRTERWRDAMRRQRH